MSSPLRFGVTRQPSSHSVNFKISIVRAFRILSFLIVVAYSVEASAAIAANIKNADRRAEKSAKRVKSIQLEYDLVLEAGYHSSLAAHIVAPVCSQLPLARTSSLSFAIQ